jgi:hypothetical protein
MVVVDRRSLNDGLVAEGWLGVDDDELLYRIEQLPPDHHDDSALLAVVRSHRHFFVRQEAAKRIRNQELLKELAEDRHVGQILVRSLNRREDLEYLQKLHKETRHLEVRKAAAVQLEILRNKHGSGSERS